MAAPLESSVRAEIRRTFENTDDAEYVRCTLEATVFPGEEFGPPPRVHVALLWLSGGHIRRFDHEFAAARSDWRDALLRAGLAGADWRRVLARRGIACDSW
ncbi:MAG: hypothetical protein HKN82_10510 [Akkermansiaceae bacterium]|nr:hypothetical protein [Akkermansiaceae bacterium]NNM28493.1 hypothetical protein [Akkermansiaceae bacterium]